MNDHSASNLQGTKIGLRNVKRRFGTKEFFTLAAC